MRTYNYSNIELDFLTRLAFHDVKQIELRRKLKEDVGERIWNRISSKLGEDFDLNEREDNYIWHNVSRMYEEDQELVNQRFRFDRRGLPLDG